MTKRNKIGHKSALQKMKAALSVLSFLTAFLLGASSPHAQGLMREDPASRTITVSYYQTDKPSGKLVLTDRWDWISYDMYYKLSSMLPSSPVVPEETVASLPPPAQKIIITEARESGDILNHITLFDGMATWSNFAYNQKYYHDVYESVGTLRKQIEIGAKNMGTATPSSPPLMTLKIGKDGPVWETSDPNDVAALRLVLSKSPELQEIERLKNRNDFNSGDLIHVEIDPSVKNMPYQIDFDGFQIRATHVVPTTRTYRDENKFWEMTLAEKELFERYRALGINAASGKY